MTDVMVFTLRVVSRSCLLLCIAGDGKTPWRRSWVMGLEGDRETEVSFSLLKVYYQLFTSDSFHVAKNIHVWEEKL